MNLTPIPYTNAPLSLLTAEQAQPTGQLLTPDAAFAADFQEMCSLAMDQALGLEKASLDSVIQMQTCVIDALENTSWRSAALSNLIDMAVQAITSCLDLQLSWLAMMAPHAIEKKETTLHVAAPALVRKAASRARNRPQREAGALEDHMDVAMGERAA